MQHLETLKIVCLTWLVIFSFGCTLVYLTDLLQKKKWLKWFKVFQYTGPEQIERQILSFDKAVLPKIATDEDGVITNVNPAAESLFGWKESELFMKNINLLIIEDEKKKFADMLADLKGEKMATKSVYQNVVQRRQKEISVEVTLRKEPIRDIYVYLFIFRDRTEELRRVRMLEQINEKQKEKLDILTHGEELGNNGSWLWNIEKKKLMTTRGYRQIIGEDDKVTEFEAQYLRDKVWKDDNDIVNEGLAKAYAGEPYEITYHIKRIDLNIAKIRSVAFPIMSENGKKLLYVFGSTHLLEIILLEDFYKIDKE